VTPTGIFRRAGILCVKRGDAPSIIRLNIQCSVDERKSLATKLQSIRYACQRGGALLDAKALCFQHEAHVTDSRRLLQEKLLLHEKQKLRPDQQLHPF